MVNNFDILEKTPDPEIKSEEQDSIELFVYEYLFTEFIKAGIDSEKLTKTCEKSMNDFIYRSEN